MLSNADMATFDSLVPFVIDYVVVCSCDERNVVTIAGPLAQEILGVLRQGHAWGRGWSCRWVHSTPGTFR